MAVHKKIEATTNSVFKIHTKITLIDKRVYFLRSYYQNNTTIYNFKKFYIMFLIID